MMALDELRRQFLRRLSEELSRTVRAHPPVRLVDGTTVRVLDLAGQAGVTALEPILAELADVRGRLDAVRNAAERMYTVIIATEPADELSIVDAIDGLRTALLSTADPRSRTERQIG